MYSDALYIGCEISGTYTLSSDVIICNLAGVFFPAFAVCSLFRNSTRKLLVLADLNTCLAGRIRPTLSKLRHNFIAFFSLLLRECATNAHYGWCEEKLLFVRKRSQ